MNTKSKNHFCFIGKYEFLKIDSQIYRASLTLPIMTDGNRCSRWEAPKLHFVNNLKRTEGVIK
jgi:hypothetical protein